MFSMTSPLLGLDSNMSDEEKLLYFAENNPNEFRAYASLVGGVQQTNWYEAATNFDKTFRYINQTEGMLEGGFFEPQVKTIEDAKEFMLYLALFQSAIPLDEL